MSGEVTRALAPIEKSMTSSSATAISGTAGCRLLTMALLESQTRMRFNPNLSGIARRTRSRPFHVRADQSAAQPAAPSAHLGNYLAITDGADCVLRKLLEPGSAGLQLISLFP